MLPSFLKKRVSKVDYLRQHLGEFAHSNRELLIIVADPETDHMFVAYKDKMVLGKVKNVHGGNLSVVKDVLRHSKMKSQFEVAMDMFLAGLADALDLSLKHGNQFYDFVRNVLFHFQPRAGQWLEDQKKKEEILKSGGQVSPIQPIERSSLPADKP